MPPALKMGKSLPPPCEEADGDQDRDTGMSIGMYARQVGAVSVYGEKSEI